MIRQADGIRLDPPHMAVGHVVLGIDRHRQRFDGRQVQPIQIIQVPSCVVEPAERGAQREMEDCEKRQHHGRGHQAALLQQQHQAERDGCGSEITNPEPAEMTSPDADRRL